MRCFTIELFLIKISNFFMIINDLIILQLEYRIPPKLDMTMAYNMRTKPQLTLPLPHPGIMACSRDCIEPSLQHDLFYCSSYIRARHPRFVLIDIRWNIWELCFYLLIWATLSSQFNSY